MTFIKWLLQLFGIKPRSSKRSKAKRKKPDSRKSIRKGELGEYKINIQLDQLKDECLYLSDLMIENHKSKTGFSQIDHVAITKYGLFVIETKNYQGEITGNATDRYWTVSNRYKLYNPLLQNYGHVQAVKQVLHDVRSLAYISIISFTMRGRFSVDPALRKIQSDQLVIYDVELSDYIQRKLTRFSLEKAPQMTRQEMENIYNLLVKANITDPKRRKQHVSRIKKRATPS